MAKLPSRPLAPARQKAAAAADKLKSGLPDLPIKGRRPAQPSQADYAAARLKVARILAPTRRPEFKNSKQVAIVESCLVALLARGGTYDDFVAEMRKRARAAARQHGNSIQQAVNLARLLQPASVQQRYRDEVVIPARLSRISGPVAWNRTNAIFGLDVRSDPKTAPPPLWTIFPAVQIGAGAILAGGWAGGICGPRFGMICWAESVSISIGASIGASFGAAVSIAPKPPQQLTGVALAIGIGVAYGAGFDIGVGLTLSSVFGEKPEDAPENVFEGVQSVLDGFSVAVTGGAEVNVSIGFSYGRVLTLHG